jgi:hypothetical protein
VAAAIFVVCLAAFLARPHVAARAAPGAAGAQPAAAAEPAATRPIAALAAERLEAAAEGFRLTLKGYEAGTRPFNDIASWSRRQAEAALDPAIPAPRRKDLLEQHVQRSRELERVAAERFRAGMGGQDEAIGAKYLRLEAELWLARDGERAQGNAPVPPAGR